jgi:hypothetical protein
MVAFWDIQHVVTVCYSKSTIQRLSIETELSISLWFAHMAFGGFPSEILSFPKPTYSI